MRLNYKVTIDLLKLWLLSTRWHGEFQNKYSCCFEIFHMVRGGFKTQPPVNRRFRPVAPGSGRLSLFRTIHRKNKMSHLTHLSHSGSVHGQNDSKICKNESFCPCSDPLWLKWVQWLIWVFLCRKRAEPDRTAGQPAVGFWNRPLTFLTPVTSNYPVWIFRPIIL